MLKGISIFAYGAAAGLGLSPATTGESDDPPPHPARTETAKSAK
jgi:hypothetical protein